jgi:hypothetical protein
MTFINIILIQGKYTQLGPTDPRLGPRDPIMPSLTNLYVVVALIAV